MAEYFVDNSAELTIQLKVLRQMAWKLHTQSGHDLEDLFSEACLQYLLLRPKFNPDKGVKFTTFIWNAVWNALIDYLRTESRIVLITDLDEPMWIKHQLRDKFVLGSF